MMHEEQFSEEDVKSFLDWARSRPEVYEQVATGAVMVLSVIEGRNLVFVVERGCLVPNFWDMAQAARRCQTLAQEAGFERAEAFYQNTYEAAMAELVVTEVELGVVLRPLQA